MPDSVSFNGFDRHLVIFQCNEALKSASGNNCFNYWIKMHVLEMVSSTCMILARENYKVLRV